MCSYANWCGHCRQFKPELERLPALIRDAGLPMRVGRVNIDENPGNLIYDVVIFIGKIFMPWYTGIASRFLVAYLPTIYQYAYMCATCIHVDDDPRM